MKSAPVFRFDSQEKWFPYGVEESVKLYGYRFGTDGRGDIGWRRVLDKSAFEMHEPVMSGVVDRLNFPRDMRPSDLPPVVYYRAVQSRHLWFHQFHWWTLYNPKDYGVLGIKAGEHEGDWELVTVASTDEAGNKPVAVVASQHSARARKDYWECELENGHPVIYVAYESHAGYFAPVRNVIDQADGEGRSFGRPGNYEIRDLDEQPWKSWEGKWGNSKNSPDGPLVGANRKRAMSPAIWMSRG